MNYTVSIIIPVYNRQDVIEFCLDSIALQTFNQENFEVIIVDDCSTDNTLSILNNYKKIKNLRVVSLEKNSGSPVVPRNKGIELATGKYIMFVDSDDIITQFALEELSNMAAKGDADFVLLYPFPSGRKRFTERYINFYDNIETVNINSDKTMSDILFRNVAIFNFYKREKLIESGIRFNNLPLNEDLMFNRFFWLVTTNAGLVGSKRACYFAPPKRPDSFSVASDKSNITLQLLFTIFDSGIAIEKKNLATERKLVKVINNLIHIFIDAKMDTITPEFCKNFNNAEYLAFIKTKLLPHPNWLHENTKIFLSKVLQYAII
ncbi:hypothetical protein FACS1894132_10880 [Clostridia bacterium]|nr:hypothetical protein FACS1894132_10880 [Clostridia bacterium]